MVYESILSRWFSSPPGCSSSHGGRDAPAGGMRHPLQLSSAFFAAYFLWSR
jgi:hypothetical protein